MAMRTLQRPNNHTQPKRIKKLDTVQVKHNLARPSILHLGQRLPQIWGSSDVNLAGRSQHHCITDVSTLNPQQIHQPHLLHAAQTQPSAQVASA